MPYLLYINGIEIELYKSKDIALTKQANDIADLTNRNANFSQNIKVPRTVNNTKALEQAGLIYKNSNFPYKINIADLIDLDTGVHLIKKGFAILLNTDKKDYNLTIYDGNINFFKAIENITLTDCGLQDLNHIKNLSNIIQTWTDTSLPYRYNIADYNGKLFTANSKLNIDYQVPSASVKYLWERVFDFIGWEFEGAIFNHEEFVDLWLTYPKPVPTAEPQLILITQQVNGIYTTLVWEGNVQVPRVEVNVLPTPVNEPDMVSVSLGGGLYYQRFLTAGVYRLSYVGGVFDSITGNGGTLNYVLRDSLGANVQNGTVNGQIDLNVLPNYTLWLYYSVISVGILSSLNGTITTKIEKINGYTLGFDQAFIDFKVSDFIKEIMVRFSLTPFPIKNQNKVKFLTLSEIFQNDNVQDWSDKYHGITNESYKLNRYAQNNLFKFKYNDQNHKHNDGRIFVNNKNLNEETTLFTSRTFSIEPKNNQGFNVYPIWSKNVKDNSQIEYKDLDNRFYFQRSERVNLNLEIESEFLALSQTANFYYRENYFRCSWQMLINVWHNQINKLLDDTKIISANIYLKPFEFANLELERMVYIDKLQSYFLINKVSNYIPEKATKVELIKIEYASENEDINTGNPVIGIDSHVFNGCQVTFNVTAENITQPIQVELLLFAFGVPSEQQVQTTQPIYGTLNTNQVTFDLNLIPYNPLGYAVRIKGYTNIFLPFETPRYPSGAGFLPFPNGCYVAPTLPNDLIITNVSYLGLITTTLNGITFALHTYKIFYSFTSLPIGQIIYDLNIEVNKIGVGWFGSGIYSMSINDLKERTFTLNVLLEPSDINKVRISINNIYSNEFNL